MRSKILGTGSYVPEEVLTNKQIEKIVDTTDEWILERTGISERRIAPKGVGVSERIKIELVVVYRKSCLSKTGGNFF